MSDFSQTTTQKQMKLAWSTSTKGGFAKTEQNSSQLCYLKGTRVSQKRNFVDPPFFTRFPLR